MKLSQDSLFKFLNERKLEPTYERNTDQIYLILKVKEAEIFLFFGIRGEGQLLQTLAYLPYTLDTKYVNEVARLLHFFNLRLDMPGFGMDEDQKLVFYRTVIPCLDKEMPEKLIEQYLAASRVVCETFMEAIGLVATGSATLDQVWRKQNVD